MSKLFLIVCLSLISGCKTPEEIKQIRCDIDATTVTKTYYLTTVVHDEHLFIISRYGHFIHHIDCPCLKIKNEEKTEPKVELPTGNILDLIRGSKP